MSRKNRRGAKAPEPTQAEAQPRWRRVVSVAVLFLGAAAASAAAALWLRGPEPTTAPPTGPDAPEAPGVRETPAPSPAPEGMAWIPGGTFWMGGNDDTMTDAQPARLVTLDGYWIDRNEVTNAEFARFVEATGYVTVAERKPDAKDFPGANPADLVAGSVVFSPPEEAVPLDNHLRWWSWVPGASWRHPEGPGSDLKDRMQHPVVQVAWDDAVEFARWAGKRLPTEAEWEFAARGGLDRQRFTWGDELTPGGKWMVNNWQGQFPAKNLLQDGYRATAPVGMFPANGFGLHDMAGNVWEWCADWYRPDAYTSSPRENPQGPPDSFDPLEPGVPKRVQRGGSYLCSDLYCVRYLPGARGKGEPSSGASHLGFRCVQDAPPSEKKP